MHHCLFATLCDLLVFVPCAKLSIASPTFEQQRTGYDPSQLTLKLPARPVYPSAHAVKYLDATPNTVGLLLTTSGGLEEEVVHLWLPLGQRVNTRAYFLFLALILSMV